MESEETAFGRLESIEKLEGELARTYSDSEEHRRAHRAAQARVRDLEALVAGHAEEIDELRAELARADQRVWNLRERLAAAQEEVVSEPEPGPTSPIPMAMDSYKELDAGEPVPRPVAWPDLEPGDLALDPNAASNEAPLLLIRKSGRGEWRFTNGERSVGLVCLHKLGKQREYVTDPKHHVLSDQCVLVARKVRANATTVARTYGAVKDAAATLAAALRV